MGWRQEVAFSSLVYACLNYDIEDNLSLFYHPKPHFFLSDSNQDAPGMN
jgi:hypothetical protein